MFETPTIIFASIAYLSLLFGIAWCADHFALKGRSLVNNSFVYVFSLAVYCTTWTYYGSVGRAAVDGIGFLPVYLGPTLMFALGTLVIKKMIRIAKENHITSIADFISSRYGKSQLLGGIVSIIAVIGIVPYIALQLKAVSITFDLALKQDTQVALSGESFLNDSVFYVALIMAIFTMMFGTRHLDATEKHEGMVAAVAFESLIKLIALTAVGIFITYFVYDGFADVFQSALAIPETARLLAPTTNYTNWTALTILSMLSVLLLPRQFQVMVVENVNIKHINRAVWLFPLYLFIINLFVLPIALAGLILFKGDVDADTFVLTLPIFFDNPWLTMFVFLGGLSAATGMVIVESIALSTMVCNNIVMPILLRINKLNLQKSHDISRWLLNIRRLAIALIMFLGYVYFRVAGEAYALVSIGLISFAAVAQFAPVVLGGMYWKGGTREGALAGLIAGFSLWLYTLLLPSFARSGWLSADFLAHGPAGIELLKPQELFGLAGLDQISHCLIWSMLANIAFYVIFSLRRPPDAKEAPQIRRFVDLADESGKITAWRGGAGVAVLLPLISRFLGLKRANEALQQFAIDSGCKSISELPANTKLVNFAENILSGAIGSASARAMVATVVEETPLSMDEVFHILDEASQIRAYSKQLEEKSFELEKATNELRLANAMLLELDQMKDDFISTVTHELRTPLTSIRVSAELMYADVEMPENERVRFLGVIVQETERLSRLINQILDMAKLESGSAVWDNQEIDLVEICNQAIAAVEQISREKQITIITSYEKEKFWLMSDADRLIQVMINLLSNAIKFVPQETGKINVNVTLLSQNANKVQVAVIDNGIGIAKEFQEDVFEKFRQVGNTLTDKPVGTGLGLPICRKIIHHLGGRLWLESEAGKGAAFIFTMPLLKSKKEE